MNSTDSKYTGAGVETPPAVGMCSTDQFRLTAPTVAPWTGTASPHAGTSISARLRDRQVAAGRSGSRADVLTARPSAPTPVLRVALAGFPSQHASSTPGDLPPEDPLSS